MLPPYSWSHSQTRSTNASRPSSSRDVPSLWQRLLDDVLRRDAGVVVAGLDEDVVALHPLPARERVAERELQRVAEVEVAGDVRRREAVDPALARRVGVGRVEAFLFPCLLPAFFDALRLIKRFHRADVVRQRRRMCSRLGRGCKTLRLMRASMPDGCDARSLVPLARRALRSRVARASARVSRPQTARASARAHRPSTGPASIRWPARSASGAGRPRDDGRARATFVNPCVRLRLSRARRTAWIGSTTSAWRRRRSGSRSVPRLLHLRRPIK